MNDPTEARTARLESIDRAAARQIAQRRRLRRLFFALCVIFVASAAYTGWLSLRSEAIDRQATEAIAEKVFARESDGLAAKVAAMVEDRQDTERLRNLEGRVDDVDRKLTALGERSSPGARSYVLPVGSSAWLIDPRIRILVTRAEDPSRLGISVTGANNQTLLERSTLSGRPLEFEVQDNRYTITFDYTITSNVVQDRSLPVMVGLTIALQNDR